MRSGAGPPGKAPAALPALNNTASDRTATQRAGGDRRREHSACYFSGHHACQHSVSVLLALQQCEASSAAVTRFRCREPRPNFRPTPFLPVTARPPTLLRSRSSTNCCSTTATTSPTGPTSEALTAPGPGRRPGRTVRPRSWCSTRSAMVGRRAGRGCREHRCRVWLPYPVTRAAAPGCPPAMLA